ncbi:conserved hypothetical protein [Coccidioides posadasii str. Silveira]|uniref:Uncharacterized protein n=1 Tax=Coccidioides posadasii (strain RMSCC 757 / Silveira) TaxID=443226 RepID=E9CRF3_COCPS|nr:conserved hypothetical protein [Coccidioides posadasii str. Silveira]
MWTWHQSLKTVFRPTYPSHINLIRILRVSSAVRMSLVTRTRGKGAKKCSSMHCLHDILAYGPQVPSPGLDEPIRNLSFTGHLKDDMELQRKRSLNSRGAKNVGERRGVGVGTLGARVGTCETAKQGPYWPPRAVWAETDRSSFTALRGQQSASPWRSRHLMACGRGVNNPIGQACCGATTAATAATAPARQESADRAVVERVAPPRCLGGCG